MRRKRITIINNRKSCISFIIFFLSTSKYGSPNVFRFLLSELRKDGSVPQNETLSLDFYLLVMGIGISQRGGILWRGSGPVLPVQHVCACLVSEESRKCQDS